jgi:hypothetical protein
MGVFHWITQHWLDLLQSIGIVGSLAFTAVSLRVDSKVRRVSNLLSITDQHRQIWLNLYKRPELARVVDPAADLTRQPVTTDEELFVTLVVLHLSSAQEAMKQGMFAAPDGLQRDIQRFFSWPIPKSVWERIKAFQDKDLVEFVETNRSEAMD